MADGGSCLPDDVLVQIFLLVPTRFRRPLRLVCKGWRTVIDERAPPEDDKLPAKILVFINHGRTSRALVFDGSSRHRTHEWTYTSSRVSGSVRMIGTCNGLLCLHDHTTYGGLSFSAVTVTNPVTCEAATLPPVPRRWASFAKAPGHYSFGFHRETKLHKVVYIPRGDRRSLDALQVLDLDGGGGGAGKPRPQWSRRYSVDENIWSSWIVAPQLTHGDYVLSEWHGWNTGRWRKISPELHRHEVGELAGGGGDDEGWRWQLPPANGKQLIVSSEELEGGEVTTFAYVETRNPVPRKK
ncbi:unnamed protein product [Urochloa decumbens]|uniref:F-box domain-containing protein n=1 Tax=Urochloa decumbens TaxID=240449 RepID=A0ABC9BHW0_9POAL